VLCNTIARCDEFRIESPLGEDGKKLLAVNVAAIVTALLLTDAKPTDGAPQLTSTAGYYYGYKGVPTDVADMRAGLMLNARKWLGAGIEFNVTGLANKDTRAIGVGCAPFVRWQLHIAKRSTVLFEQGAGLMFTSKDFPTGGSSANFTPVYGIGFKYDVFEKSSVLIELRHSHISNGGVFAANKGNPGFDSYGFEIGWVFGF
jgi:hypothetical protein